MSDEMRELINTNARVCALGAMLIKAGVVNKEELEAEYWVQHARFTELTERAYSNPSTPIPAPSE